MGQEIITRFFSRPETEEKKPIKPLVVWLIIGSILFLALGSCRDNDTPKTDVDREESSEVEVEVYLENLEQRLKGTLEKIHGAGEVSVFLNLEDGGEQVLATNRIQKSQDEEEENSTSTMMEEESDIIRWNQDGIETPYAIKKRLPEPSGILVVAEGAAKEEVRQEIYEAVRAIFGLPAHRIKITN